MLGRDIRDLVTVKMDEYTPYGPSSSTPLLAGGDSLNEVKPIYSYSDKTLYEAANEALSVIPIWHLTPITKNYQGGPAADGMNLAGLQLIDQDGYIVANNIPIDDEGYIITPDYSVDEDGYLDASQDSGEQSEADVDAEDNLIGAITKPSNWLRLHTLQMAGWVRPVHEVVRPGTSKYNQQFTRWKRGTPQKPIVTDDGSVLRYYSQPRTVQAGQILTLKYITMFDESIDYPSKVAEVIALYCARKICEIYGMTEQLGIMTNEINGVLENMQR